MTLEGSSPRGALLVGGTTSDAGKSLIVAGLCRLLSRNGIRVAPFKAQNMSNNSVVTVEQTDSGMIGGEIGRAQAMQAFACGLEPSVRFNPVLLKPGSDRRSQVVVRGRVDGEVGAADYHSRRAALASIVDAELASLRADFDVVICEGAGSVAEVNLRADDIANMGLARRAEIPVVIAADIDRGGVLAHLLGTLAALDAHDQRLVSGFLINKFRGDQSLLAPGVEWLDRMTARPTLGVLPFLDGVWLDAEDSLSTPVGATVGPASPGGGARRLGVAAIRLPRVSNTTDVEALACEPGVDVRWVDDPAAVAAADLVVVPGTKATVDDLAWLRGRGIDVVLSDRAALRQPVLAICGGYQMLCRRIDDRVESGAGVVEGLGLFDASVRFDEEKVVRNATGSVWGLSATGYEIHHGRITGAREQPWIHDDLLGDEGGHRDALWGTHWHGLLAGDEVRRAFLHHVAQFCAPDFAVAPDTDFDAVRRGQLDLMADTLQSHADIDALVALIDSGPPDNLPVVSISAR